MLYARGSDGRGIGPHRDLMRELLLDMCKHDTSFLELNAEKRQIRARTKNLSPRGVATCAHCANQATHAAIAQLMARHHTVVPDSMCMLAAVASLANIDFFIVQECIRIRLEMPYTFTMTALVAALNLDTNNQRSAAIELSEAGIYKTQVADCTFAERAQVEQQRVVDCFNRRPHSGGYRQFDMFMQCFAQSRVIAYNSLYFLMNRTLLDTRVAAATVFESTASLPLEQMRVIVSSLLAFEPLSKQANLAYTEFLRQLADISIPMADFVAIAVNPELMDSIPKTLPMGPFIGVVATNAKLRAGWRLFQWLLDADYAQLCAFLKAMGVQLDVVLRCASAFFASRERSVYFAKAKQEYDTTGKRFLGTGPSQLEELHHSLPQFELSLLASQFWMRSDLIRVQMEPDSARLPTISTCVRVLNWPIGMPQERTTQAMANLLAASAGGGYLLS